MDSILGQDIVLTDKEGRTHIIGVVTAVNAHGIG